jgi:hypothetical protein
MFGSGRLSVRDGSFPVSCQVVTFQVLSRDLPTRDMLSYDLSSCDRPGSAATGAWLGLSLIVRLNSSNGKFANSRESLLFAIFTGRRPTSGPNFREQQAKPAVVENSALSRNQSATPCAFLPRSRARGPERFRAAMCCSGLKRHRRSLAHSAWKAS